MVLQGLFFFQLIPPSVTGYQDRGLERLQKIFALVGPSTALAAEPVADAGEDQAGIKDQGQAGTISLNGSASFDPDGDPLVYRWYGPFETIEGETVDIVVPEGVYTISLRVNDGSSRSEIDTTQVTLSPCFEISARSKRGQVQLTWTHLEGTQRYVVFRAPEYAPFDFEVIGETTSTYSTYLDTTVSNETTYLYLVQAVPDCAENLENPCMPCYSSVVANHPSALRRPPNSGPVIYSPPVINGTEGIIYNYDIHAADPNGDSIFYSLSSFPEGMSIDGATGLITWTPESSGTYEVTATITDTGAGSDTQSFVVTVEDLPVLNQSPSITSTPLVTAVEGQLYTYDVDATDPDPDDVLVYSLDNPPTGMEINTETGLIQWTPGETQVDEHMILIRVEDRGGLFDTQVFTLAVSPSTSENIIPVAEAGPDQTQTLIHGQSEKIVALNGSGSSDPDGTITGYTWTSESGVPDPENIAEPSIALTAGTYQFALIVTDDDGAASIADTVTIIINPAPPVGGPPVISIDPLTYTVNEGGSLSIDVMATDPDGDVVTLSASPKLDNAQFSSTPGTQATGTFSFTPDYTRQGMYVIAIKARDPLGLTATQTVRITVTNVNRSPQISAPDSLTIDEGGLLTILIQASDPDKDVLTLTAEPLPDNAIFIPATGTITFTPDFDQAGTYTINCQTHDGELSDAKSVQVTVNDVPDAVQQDLVLDVDPVESPTFLGSTRVTGTVNSSGTTAPRLTSALITGMNPITGKQGETIDITLTGQTSGDFDTHFMENVSQAGFGNDITINSITINSPSQAVVNVSIDPDALEGPRSITVVTDKETAFSALAFNVVKGQASATGILVDSVTEQSIAGAIVTIQGTDITTTTDVNGAFTFTDIPTGEHVIVINAQDHELITMTINSQVGQPLDIGSVGSSSTVFDPSAPPSVNIFSVIGRGAGLMIPKLNKSELEQMITDTVLLVGETQAGIIDAYGNQLNPQLAADALISLTSAGVEQIADRMLRNETMSLSNLLFAFSQSFQWGGTGERISLENWLLLLQENVNQAWTDPTNPDNFLSIVIFNNRNVVTPDPPQISHLTRLNALQAYLFSSSLYAYMNERTQ